MNTKSLSRVEIKDADKGTISAVFSTLATRGKAEDASLVDKDGDVTWSDAFEDGQPVVISSFQHTSWDGAQPLGKGAIRTTRTEAVLEGQFFMDTQKGADGFRVVKALSEDNLQQWSYSLHDVKSSLGQFGGKDVRFLESIHVKEVSPVLIGAGVNTRTLSIKSGMKFSDERDAVLTALRDLGKRATEVVTLRAEQGKSYASVTELYEAITAEAERIKACIDGHTTSHLDEGKAALQREYLRYVSLTQGA